MQEYVRNIENYKKPRQDVLRLIESSRKTGSEENFNFAGFMVGQSTCLAHVNRLIP